MPIYDEKLICPLAVRFTQEHIRPVFQDDRELEATIQEIKTTPSTGEYDVILEPPFPNIEIVRWRMKDPDGVEPEAKHWCTLDNRRLYCLQRAAVAVWPKRAAVKVDLLYAAVTGDIRRKDDSCTMGRTVGIGHSLKMLTDRWDWRERVTANEEDEAYARAVLDDQKLTHSELIDAPKPLTMMERFLLNPDDESCHFASTSFRGLDDSTTVPSSPRSGMSSDGLDPSQALNEGLCGIWEGEKGDFYEIKESGVEACWICSQCDGGGRSKKYKLWYDEESDGVWWGDKWNLYVKAAVVRTRHYDEMKWFTPNDRRTPRYTWWKVEAASNLASTNGRHGDHLKSSNARTRMVKAQRSTRGK